MELTAVALQTIAENQNVVFTDVAVCGCPSIIHRNGSGLVTLRGLTNQCRARFKVSFGGNIAVPTGGTVGAISLAISIDGEPLGSTIMIETPAAVEEFNNVFTAVYVDIPRGCCSTIGVKNISDQPISIQNANLIIERVA